MIYKGREVEDHHYEWKRNLIESLSGNSQNFTLSLYISSQDFTLDDIEAWKELIIKKTEELKSKGVEFKDVTIQIVGDGFRYNPNGADYESYMAVYLKWWELETDEEREKRIERTKKRIDEEIEQEKRSRELAEHKENERSIETLQKAGFQVI